MTTRVTVNVVRHEVLVYEFDDELDQDEALEEIATGHYDPVGSKIISELTDVIDHEVTR